MQLPTINVDPSYCNTDDQNKSSNPNTSSNTSKPKVLLPRLNTTLRNNCLYAPSPLSVRSLGQNRSDDATDFYINSPRPLTPALKGWGNHLTPLLSLMNIITK